MRRAPTVPGELENALINLAGQYSVKTYVNVYSEAHRLLVHAVVQYRQPIRWTVTDYDYPIEFLEGQMQLRLRNPRSNVLYEWDDQHKRLAKRSFAGLDYLVQ
jgi:hypothetical protein